MRFAIIASLLVASMTLAAGDPGVTGIAYLDGSSSWSGYFEITFLTSSGDTVEGGPYYNAGYLEYFRGCSYVHMSCRYYSSNGWLVARKSYNNVLVDFPVTVQNPQFLSPLDRKGLLR